MKTIPGSGKFQVTSKKKYRFVLTGVASSFPSEDCVLLPIEHSSAEELAEYIVSTN